MPLTYEQRLTRAEDIAPKPGIMVCHANPYTEPFEMGDIGACPDNVRNGFPIPAQEAFRRTFNTNLRFTGSVEYAMRAGMKAARQMARMIQSKINKRSKTDDTYAIMRDIDDVHSLRRAQIVVA